LPSAEVFFEQRRPNWCWQRSQILTSRESVSQTPELFRDALALYQHRPDKSWSLTDCASFLIMDRQQIAEALTHDRHFEQRGYRTLLRD
jgi:predicted nucleic acid-binding protein